MRILVVDDEPMVQFLLEQFLTEEGHSVEIAQNGVDALERLETEPFDLIFTDVHMPYLSGIGLVQRLHQQGCTIPIVVMDSYPEAFLESGFADRACALLAKPFDLSEVRQVLQQVGTLATQGGSRG